MFNTPKVAAKNIEEVVLVKKEILGQKGNENLGG